MDNIRALGCNSEEDERAFAAVARLSEVTHGLYRSTLQPLVRTTTTPQSAQWLHATQPLRLGYKLFSDQSPMMKWVELGAEKVRAERKPVSENNLFRLWEKFWMDTTARNLDFFRDWRDALQEQTFFAIYGNPWVQALLGLKATDGSPRPHPGIEQTHLDYVAERIDELRAGMDKGGPKEAAIRALVYVRMPARAADERGFEMLRRTRVEHGKDMTLEEFKAAVRNQYLTLLLDERKALETIPVLLKGHEDSGAEILQAIERVVTAAGALDEEGKRRLQKIKSLLAPAQTSVPRRKPRKVAG